MGWGAPGGRGWWSLRLLIWLRVGHRVVRLSTQNPAQALCGVYLYLSRSLCPAPCPAPKPPCPAPNPPHAHALFLSIIKSFLKKTKMSM